MVFEFLKNTMNDINEEWDSMEPERLHKQAFEFLQKEFDAWPFLPFDRVQEDLKKTNMLLILITESSLSAN
jgi:hypothetical protein